MKDIENKERFESPYRLKGKKQLIRQLRTKIHNRLIFIYMHLFPP